MNNKDMKADESGLEVLRSEIDECDREIIGLLSRRFELVEKIGLYKARHNLPVRDEAREREILADRKHQAASFDGCIERIFRFILQESRQVQDKVRESIPRPDRKSGTGT